MSKIRVLKLRTALKKNLQVINTMEVLKQIAVSEFRYLEHARQERTKFMKFLGTFFLFYKSQKLNDMKFLSNGCKRRAIVVISSDEGFLGALNTQILEKGARLYEESGRDAKVIAVGRRGVHKLSDRGVPAEPLPGVPFPLTYEAVLPLKKMLIDGYLKKEFGSVDIVRAVCHSFTHQSVESVQLLPLSLADITRSEGLDVKTEESPDYLVIEPHVKPVIEYTIALWLGRRLFEIYWDSKLSEVASRAIELTERYEALSRKSAKTRLQYFRACHEVIDTGIREVFSSHHFFSKNQEEVAP